MSNNIGYICIRGLFLAGLIAVWTGCGLTGANAPTGTTTPPGPGQTVSTFVTDAASDSVVSLHLDVTGIALTDTATHTATLSSGKRSIEIRHLELAPTLVAQTANISPQSYTSISCTFANPVMHVSDTQGKITILTDTTVPSVRLESSIAAGQLTFPTASNVGLMVDLDLQRSISRDAGGNYVISPVINTSLVSDSDTAPQLNDTLGKVVAISGSSMDLSLSEGGETIHAVTDANTLFDSAVGGFSSMKVGDVIEITAQFHSNGTYLATFISAGPADPSLRHIGLVTSAGRDSLGNFLLSLVPQN